MLALSLVYFLNSSNVDALKSRTSVNLQSLSQLYEETRDVTNLEIARAKGMGGGAGAEGVIPEGAQDDAKANKEAADTVAAEATEKADQATADKEAADKEVTEKAAAVEKTAAEKAAAEKVAAEALVVADKAKLD